MRAFGLLLLLVACGSDGLKTEFDPDADVVIEGWDFAIDPCGAKDPNTGAYGCAFLVGGCPTAGLSCFCWERGTMVCQENLQWELILDLSNCPDLHGGSSYQGLGCLGARDHCGSCSCNPTTKKYECADGGA